jgi:hypothetical protein
MIGQIVIGVIRTVRTVRIVRIVRMVRIVIRRSLWAHNDTPFGRPNPGRLIGRPGVGHPSGVNCMF